MKTLRASVFRYSAFFLILHFTLALGVLAQRADNRRLVWTGSGGNVWGNSSASWMTTGSYLSSISASADSAEWLPATALNNTPFLAGDVAIFDSYTDAGYTWNGSSWVAPVGGDATVTRVINIAPEGVSASDVVVSGPGSHVFTGGAIIVDPASIAPGSVQLTGTGVPNDSAYQNLAPTGRLIKLGGGDLTLSNTAANVFKGGIYLAVGSLTIAVPRALGNNNISIYNPTSVLDASVHLPVIVTGANDALLSSAVQSGAVSIRVPDSGAGLNITGDIYIHNKTLTLNIQGDTTISGRITSSSDSNTYGIPTTGVFTKTGTGTLTITGESNWIAGPNTVSSGTLIATQVGALGRGNISIAADATLAFRGVRDGANFPEAITGGSGRVDVIDSNMTLNYRHGYVIGASGTANSSFRLLNVMRSRLFALASGTLASGLGGLGSTVNITDHSTLVLGREGIVAAVSGLVAPVNYAVNVLNFNVDATSALVLNPGANLTVTGTLTFEPGAVFTFSGAGFSRMEYVTLDPGSANPDIIAAAPAGCTLETTRVTGEGGRLRRDYLVINQAANPARDIAMTNGAIGMVVDSVTSRLNELFLLPAAEPNRNRQKRKWANIAWARYLDSSVDYDAASDLHPGYHGRLQGLALGMDSAYRQRVLIGIHGGMVSNNITSTNDTSLMSKQRYFGFNVTPRFKNYYLTADVLAGTADSESLRREGNGSTTAHWKNSFHGGGIEIGAVLRPWKDGFMRPRAGLRYTSIDSSSYTERAPMGASAMGVGNFTDRLANFNMAIEAAHRFRLFARDTLFGATLAYKLAVLEPHKTLDAGFRDYPGQGFTLERGNYYEDAASLGVSLRMAVTLRTRAGLSLDYERGSRHDRLAIGLVVNYIW